MSYRTVPGIADEHNPMMKEIIDFGKEHATKEPYRTSIRGSNPNGIFDRTFPSEPFGKPGRDPTNLATGIAVVVIIVIIIILVGYLIHLHRIGKDSDPEYFDQFKLWGADDYEMSPLYDNEPEEIIDEVPASEVLAGGDVASNMDVCSLVNDKKRSHYII